MRAWRACSIALLLALALAGTHCSATENATQGAAVIAVPDTDTTADATVTDGAQPDDGEADLLKWALKHVDPAALQAQAEAAKAASHSGNDADAAERRARAAELLRAVNDLPSEAELMEDALGLLRNASATAADRAAALEALAVLVEPIDNADHLLKIEGAIEQLVELLGSAPGLEAAAARVLGVAASNNPSFTDEVVKRHPDAILRLVQLLGGAAEDTVAAATYAAGQLLRGSPSARGLWMQASGGRVLVAMVRGGAQVSLRSRKRALVLATDLIQADPGSEDGGPLAEALVGLLREQADLAVADMDLDMVEKALLAAQAVGGRNRSGRGVLRSGDALEVLKDLKAALKVSGAPEYAADVAELAEEVAKGTPVVGRGCSSCSNSDGGCGGGGSETPLSDAPEPHDEL